MSSRDNIVVNWCCVGFADDVIVAIDVDGFDAGSSLVLVRASNNLVYFVPRSFVWPSTGESLASLTVQGTSLLRESSK